MQTEIEFAPVESLFLDAKNPRLGRHNTERSLDQSDVLEIMRDWSLEELAVSMLESGFWPQEALIAVREAVGREKNALVVVEGNRRLAALKMILLAKNGTERAATWKTIVNDYDASAFSRLKSIPYILKESRKSVQAYLGFRHVTGIKEWDPAEKAQFIAHLIEDEKLSYEQVRKRIGSKTPQVRQNYISYRLLLQMEEQDKIDIKKVEDRFSVLYLSLRTEGVQQYLDIDISSDPSKALKPVPRRRLEHLVNFAKWLFGDEKQDAIVSDSRQVDQFGLLLENANSLAYLERTEQPSFAVARRLAGVAEIEVAAHIERAADEIEEALKAAHQHKKSVRVQTAVQRVGLDAFQLLQVFPEIKKQVLKEN